MRFSILLPTSFSPFVFFYFDKFRPSHSPSYTLWIFSLLLKGEYNSPNATTTSVHENMAMIATVYPFKQSNGHRRNTENIGPKGGFQIEDVTDDPRVFTLNKSALQPPILHLVQG